MSKKLSSKEQAMLDALVAFMQSDQPPGPAKLAELKRITETE